MPTACRAMNCSPEMDFFPTPTTAAVQPMATRGDIATPFRNIGIEPISLLTCQVMFCWLQ
jgi:hypothetical protein